MNKEWTVHIKESKLQILLKIKRYFGLLFREGPDNKSNLN